MSTVSSTLMWAVLTGPTNLVCHIGTLTLCVEAVAWSCIIATWCSGSGMIQAWSRRPTGFLQCFDTVGLVIWPVKIVPEMTYNMSSGTLSLYTTLPLDSMNIRWCRMMLSELTAPHAPHGPWYSSLPGYSTQPSRPGTHIGLPLSLYCSICLIT